jgi:penicillin-binding protein 1A
MTPEANAEMTGMLVRTVTEGTGTAANLGDWPIAGKTGTSQDYRDAWFVGFTADLVTGVWIGNDDATPMKRATGGGMPARVFKAFMRDAERDFAPRPLPGSTFILPPVDLVEAEPVPEFELSPPPTEGEDADDNRDLLDAFEDLLDNLF